jgi:hypothetical protein
MSETGSTTGGGWQFGPFQFHHPVCRYRTLPVTRAFVPRNAGFSSSPSSPYRSPPDEKAVFARLSLHPKIPFPAARATTAHYPRGSPRILGVFGSNKGPFKPGPLLIADSTPALGTAGSILAEQYEVALLVYRGANDLRLPQLFTTKRQKGWAVSVAGTMQISAGKLALRFLPASLSQLECELVA